MQESKNLRIVALDIGIKTIGIAVTDPLWLFSRPVGTIKRRESIEQDLEEFQKLCKDFEIAAFVVGWPLYADGSETQVTAAVKGFEKRIKKIYPKAEFFRQDERYSTKNAEEKLGLKLKDREKAKKSGKIDAAAASEILENFMQIQSFRDLKEKFLKEL